MQLKSGEAVAQFTQELVKVHSFCGECKSGCLQIELTMLDINTIILAFICAKKRRWDCVSAECMRHAVIGW